MTDIEAVLGGQMLHAATMHGTFVQMLDTILSHGKCRLQICITVKQE